MTNRNHSASGIRHGDPQHAAAVQFLYDRINYETIGSSGSRYPFGLRRMRALLSQLGLGHFLDAPGIGDAPDAPPGASGAKPRRVPLVHIAGTKGKGSTSTMVAAMLSAAGYRTGLYTSPHLHRLEERFRVDGQECSAAELVSIVDRLRQVVQRETDSPTSSGSAVADGYSFFELTTALALLHFERSGCDAVVLEVGLGGRLDSTNVCAPSVTAITSIGLDHQHVLGHTLAEIAREKAGIIKPGVPVVCGVMADEPRQVIHAVAADKSAPLWQRGRDYDFTSQPHQPWGSLLQFSGHTPPLSPQLHTVLSLEGLHQAANAAIAIAIMDLLRAQGLRIESESASRVLENVRCDGRLERYSLPHNVLGIIDCAHNQDSIEALVGALRSRCGGRPLTIVFGTSRDKAADIMLGQLAGVADRLILTRFLGNPRYQTTSELRRLVPASHKARTRVVENPIAACEQGLVQATPGGVLVVCGSFFLAAETRDWMASQSQ